MNLNQLYDEIYVLVIWLVWLCSIISMMIKNWCKSEMCWIELKCLSVLRLGFKLCKIVSIISGTCYGACAICWLCDISSCYCEDSFYVLSKKKRVGTLDTQCFLSEIIRLYYVGFATYHRVTVRTRFTFCQKKKKKRVGTLDTQCFLSETVRLYALMVRTPCFSQRLHI